MQELQVRRSRIPQRRPPWGSILPCLLLQFARKVSYHLKDTENLQKKLFDEIKARIKLDDESLPYKDHTYEYWSKTTAIGNYSIKLRKKIDTDLVEEIWNGDEEKKKLETEYFGVGDLEVSNNDKYLGYSLDTKGSEYYTIFIRDIKTNKIITKEITETSGGITFSLDDKYVFYSKLDQNHRLPSNI